MSQYFLRIHLASFQLPSMVLSPNGKPVLTELEVIPAIASISFNDERQGHAIRSQFQRLFHCFDPTGLEQSQEKVR